MQCIKSLQPSLDNHGMEQHKDIIIEPSVTLLAYSSKDSHGYLKYGQDLDLMKVVMID